MVKRCNCCGAPSDIKICSMCRKDAINDKEFALRVKKAENEALMCPICGWSFCRCKEKMILCTFCSSITSDWGTVYHCYACGMSRRKPESEINEFFRNTSDGRDLDQAQKFEDCGFGDEIVEIEEVIDDDEIDVDRLYPDDYDDTKWQEIEGD